MRTVSTLARPQLLICPLVFPAAPCGQIAEEWTWASKLGGLDTLSLIDEDRISIGTLH